MRLNIVFVLVVTMICLNGCAMMDKSGPPITYSPAGVATLHVNRRPILADMSGIPPEKREKFAEYMQDSFDAAMRGGSLGQMMKMRKLSHEDQALYLNMFSKMLSDEEHVNVEGGGESTLGFLKIKFYDLWTFSFYNDCVEDLGYEQCAVQVFLPLLANKETDPWFRKRLASYTWDTMATVNNQEKRAFDRKYLDPIMDVMISIFKDESNSPELRREAAVDYLREELRYDVFYKNLKYLETVPELYRYQGPAFVRAQWHFPQLAEYFYEILEHPEAHKFEVVEGAYAFVHYDCMGFAYDHGDYRRKRTIKILEQLMTNPKWTSKLDVKADYDAARKYGATRDR